MSAFKLNITFDSADLKTIFDAHIKVVIVKQVSPNLMPVAWVAFEPSTKNTIEWEQDYGIYVSASSVQSGTSLNKLSEVAAVPKVWYPFADGTFSEPENEPQVADDTYAVINQYPKSIAAALTFGLSQNISVNGTGFAHSPISAQSVPAMEKIQFRPSEKISVFLGYGTKTGMLMSEVYNNVRELNFADGTAEKSIEYDANTGQFMLL